MKGLRSERLVLEPVARENAKVLWRLMQSAHLREFQDVPRYTRDEFERRVASRPKRFDVDSVGRFEWLVVLTATKQAVGWVSLRTAERTRGTAEIGYSIVSTFRRNGYATEAAREIVRFAFEESELQRLEACCVPANVTSLRLLANLGFAETAVQRHGAIVRGVPVDIIVCELSRERWRKLDVRYVVTPDRRTGS